MNDVPRDRRRRPDEDVIAWAIETQRIPASKEGRYRRDLAAGRISASAIESLASTLPEGSGGVVRAAAQHRTARPVRAAAPPTGDPAAEALNSDAAYSEASMVEPAPELFPGGGALPLATASGLAPHALSGVPWWLRPAIAEAKTLPEAVELLQDASTPDGVAAASMEDRYTGSQGLQDFMGRVQSWAMQGAAAAGAREWERVADESKRVAAAATVFADDRTDDELYDAIFGSAERHREGLREQQRRYNDARRNR